MPRLRILLFFFTALFSANVSFALPEVTENDNVTIFENIDGQCEGTFDLLTPEYLGPLSISKIYQTENISSVYTVLVFVNSDISLGIQDSLDQYVADLERDGYAVVVLQSIGGTPDDLKMQIKNQWAQFSGTAPVVGVVLVGDFPVPFFEMYDDFNGYSIFPIDLYLMDLDGQWEDLDSNGTFDSHEDGAGDKNPDIWLGRLTAGPLEGSETDLLNKYFARNHEYRNIYTYYDKDALLYIDDDWTPWSLEFNNDLALANKNVILVNDNSTTVAEDYKQHLTKEYEWIQIMAHSSPYSHAFKVDGLWTGGSVYNYEVQSIGPKANFYNLFACSNARYTSPNYMGGWYIFSEGDGLAAIGSTKTGSMLAFSYFYTPFGSGKNIGESFKEWFISRSPYDINDRQWFYGMTLLGDPTLKKQLSALEDLTTWDRLNGIEVASLGGDHYLLTHPGTDWPILRKNLPIIPAGAQLKISFTGSSTPGGARLLIKPWELAATGGVISTSVRRSQIMSVFTPTPWVLI